MDGGVALAERVDGWIGADGPWPLPDGWTWAEAQSFADVVGGGTPSDAADPANFDTDGVPWITPADLSGYSGSTIRKGARSLSPTGLQRSSTQMLPTGSVLISSRAPVGYCVVAEVPVCTNQGFKSLRLKTSIDPFFIRYFVLHAKRRLNDAASGTTFKELSGRAMEQILFPLAPLAEQRRIVARVEALFSEIAEGEAALAAARKGLDTFRRALLKAAVTGKLTKDWRAANPVTETGHDMLALIAKELATKAPAKGRGRRNADAPPLDTSVLPELPEDWAWARWRDVGQSQNGRPFPSGEYAESGVRLLRPGNLFADGRVRWSAKNTRFLPEKFAESNADLIIRGGELVINLTAQSLKDEFLGRVCITDNDEYCLLNQRLGRLTPIGIDRNYMLLVFKSSLFRTFVSGLNSGSLIQHMFTSQIEDFCLPVPPPAEAAEILRRVSDALSASTDTLAMLDAEAADAARLKQSILKAAFEGRLVPQDPADEPAGTLLARIASNPRPPSARRGKAKSRR